ncbi:MAG: 2OG-Fe(II) oxygenase family protein [Candidatus Thiodiazotropha sp.]
MSYNIAVSDGPPPEYRFDQVAEDLSIQGWSVVDGLISPIVISELATEITRLWQKGRFRRISTGYGNPFRYNPEMRGDQAMWLDSSHCLGAQRLYMNAMEELRQSLNRKLNLGLSSFDSHMAVYQPGSFNRKHLDQSHRIGRHCITSILYLNNSWSESDGGQLRIFTDAGNEKHFEEILPFEGRLVTFLSARYLYEIAPSKRHRMSMTGWFYNSDAIN